MARSAARRRFGRKGPAAFLAQGRAKLLWKVSDLGRGWSSPIITGGRVYLTGDVDDHLVVYAFDLKGELVWRTTNGRSWTGSFPGARACCAYSEGRLYNMNAHGRVACLEATTGRELWSTNILKRFEGKNITWAVSECLLVDGMRLIVTPGGKQALVAALDKRDGRTLWTTPPLGSDRVTHSSPILFRWAGRRLIANCSSAHGFGIDAGTGKLLWTVPLKNRFGTNVATPIFGSGGVYFVTPYAEHGRLYRLRPDGHGVAVEHVWTCPLDTVTGSGVLIDGTLFSAAYRRPKWWFAIDWRTGRTKYEMKEFTTGAAIWADGRLIVLDERGNVGLLEPGQESAKIAGRFSLVDKRVRDAWAHPVLLNGRLYLRYHDTMWCYDIHDPQAETTVSGPATGKASPPRHHLPTAREAARSRSTARAAPRARLADRDDPLAKHLGHQQPAGVRAASPGL